jgi:hypothetical protein
VIFSTNRKLVAADDKRPNVILLIGIVLFTGIQGGVAGPRFALLDNNKEKVIA